MVQEQSVQAHFILTGLGFEFVLDSGTVRSAGDNHDSSQYLMVQKQRSDGHRDRSTSSCLLPVAGEDAETNVIGRLRKLSPMFSLLAHVAIGDCCG